MAVYAFAHAIAQGRPIEVANGGRVWRDFTYVDDIVEGVVRVLDRPARPDPAWDAQNPDPATSAAPHRIYNIGNDHPEELNRLIALIEEALGGRGARGRALAARRRSGDPRLRDGPAPGRGLRARYAAGGGRAPVRGVVPGLLQSLKLHSGLTGI
jgi:nucleoside-diphosphate-sugar epimerase